MIVAWGMMLRVIIAIESSPSVAVERVQQLIWGDFTVSEWLEFQLYRLFRYSLLLKPSE